MTQEEKYKAALERARHYYLTGKGEPVDFIKMIFPEIEESEDERIRKELIEFLKLPHPRFVGNREHEKWIAWLEKQGEQHSPVDINKMVDEFAHTEVKGYGIPSMIEVCAYRKGIEDALEKQREQKTAVYVPKFRVGDIVKSKSRPMLDARKIISIDKDCYWCEDGRCLGFAWEDDYELVEQKSTDKTESFKASDWYVSKVDGKIHNIYQSVDKAEPKFKAGDWIVDNKTPNDVFCVIEVLEEIYKVIDVDGDDYHIPHCKADKQFHLWTIQDAKVGDVLVTSPEKGSESNEQIFLFKAINSRDYVDDCIEYYFRLYDGVFYNNTIGYMGHMGTILDTFYPATKEQRDLLFQKMADAGYEWDSDKKKLKKIEVASNESEDERTKREIRNFIWEYPDKLPERTKWLAWFEKQGEKKSVDEVLKIRQELYQSGYNDGYKHGQEDIAKSLDKKSGDEELKGITQWMPMPEPPKKGGNQ